MRILRSAMALAGAAVLALAAVNSAQAAPEREAPRYGGTLNVATVFAGLNARSFRHYN